MLSNNVYNLVEYILSLKNNIILNKYYDVIINIVEEAKGQVSFHTQEPCPNSRLCWL